MSAAVAVVIGLVADRAWGEPPERVHPVAAFGRAMTGVERAIYADSRRHGALFAIIGTGGAWITGRALAGRHGNRLARRRGTGQTARLRAGASLAAATALAVAGRSLGRAAIEVATPLEAGRIADARQQLAALAGRDPEHLDEAGIARAVVESVAENTSDAVVAPALWGWVAGAPGALGYRAANTLDAMVGYRNERYRRFGWAAARADDVANWVPARATAALVVACRPRTAAAVWSAVRRDARAHPSPNAGVVEAAFAAALGLRLGGTNTYRAISEARGFLGDGRAPDAGDIARAVALSRDVTAALAAAMLMVSTVVSLGAHKRGEGRA